MVVLCQTTGRLHLLAKLDRVVSKLHYAVFWLLPYYPCFSSTVWVADLTGIDNEGLDKMAGKDIEESDEKNLDVRGLSYPELSLTYSKLNWAWLSSSKYYHISQVLQLSLVKPKLIVSPSSI